MRHPPGHGIWGVSAEASANLSPRIPRFLQTAEMVKPSTPSPSHESSSSSGSDEGTEYYPHLGEKLSGAREAGRGEREGQNQGHGGRGGAGRRDVRKN